jgi:hypothetical protein
MVYPPEKLDLIWQTMKATASLRLDPNKCEQYEHFKIWANVVLPCIPKQFQFGYQMRMGEFDADVKVFSYFASLCSGDNPEDKIQFDIEPTVETVDYFLVPYGGVINILHKDDFDIVTEWIERKDLKDLQASADHNSDDGIGNAYANIFRRGLEQFIGPSHVKVTVLEGNTVHVEVYGFRQMIASACVRQTNLKDFYYENISVIFKLRKCTWITHLIPSDRELEIEIYFGMNVFGLFTSFFFLF